MPCTVAVGGFFGDEGKGKVIAYLSIKDSAAIAVRGGVGANAGHTFVYRDHTYKVRMLPSAILNQSTRLLLGAGVLVTPSILIEEIQKYLESEMDLDEKKDLEKAREFYINHSKD